MQDDSSYFNDFSPVAGNLNEITNEFLHSPNLNHETKRNRTLQQSWDECMISNSEVKANDTQNGPNLTDLDTTSDSFLKMGNSIENLIKQSSYYEKLGVEKNFFVAIEVFFKLISCIKNHRHNRNAKLMADGLVKHLEVFKAFYWIH